MRAVRVIRSITGAVLAFHRWFMKYSGTTMIIDNIEERRRLRNREGRSDEDSGDSDRRDTHEEG